MLAACFSFFISYCLPTDNVKDTRSPKLLKEWFNCWILGFFFTDIGAKIFGLIFAMKNILHLKKIHTKNKRFLLIPCFVNLHLSRQLSSLVSKQNYMLIHIYSTIFDMVSWVCLIHLRFHCIFSFHQKRVNWCRPPLATVSILPNNVTDWDK